jgi:anti-sigma28 factor (negative regulator of flagellin synthesis)
MAVGETGDGRWNRRPDLPCVPRAELREPRASVGASVMSNVNGIGGSTPVQRIIANPIQKTVGASATESSKPTDRLELSGLSGLLKAAKQNDVRLDKVAEVRSAIEAGTYESDEKLDGAIDKMLDDLLK